VVAAPRPLRQIRDTVPPPVESVVATALAKAPADRYPTARQFAEALGPEALTPIALSAATVAAGSSAAIPAAAAPGRLLGFLGRRPLFAVLLRGLAIGRGILFAGRARHPAEDIEGARNLAVLPFENLGPADQDYFVDGITDEIRGRLTALPALRVTSRSSSSQYRDTKKSPQELGPRGVQVGIVLESRGHRIHAREASNGTKEDGLRHSPIELDDWRRRKRG
jgi:serine/threonine-protein kinase